MQTKILNLPAIIVLLASVLGVVSCSKDFLNNTPKGYQLAATVADYNNMLEENTLSSMANYTSGSGAFMLAPGPGILGDDVATLYPVFTMSAPSYGGTLLATQSLFQWKADVWVRETNSNELQACYNKIYISNKIINEVLQAGSGSEQQKKQYHAEGLANRAYNYFLLLNLFTQPYDAAGVEKEPGLPLLTEANAIANSFQRASLKATYDFMINDLVTAIPDLPLVQTNSNRFTRAAGEALLGKIYLFMGRAADAETQLDAAFHDLPAAFSISGTIGLIDYNTAAENPFPVYSYVFTTPAMSGAASAQSHPYPESLLSRELLTPYIGGQMMTGLVVTPETLSLFGGTDKRLHLYSSEWGAFDGQPGSIPFGLKRINVGNFGYSIGIQLPDMYLLRAEAKARNNHITDAITSLVTLRKARMPEADATQVPSDQNTLIRFIVDERRREFCGLGIFRWHDMRRLSKDPLFAGAVYKHYEYDQTAGLTNTYTLSPERLTLRFPQIVIAQNPGFEQNP